MCGEKSWDSRDFLISLTPYFRTAFTIDFLNSFDAIWGIISLGMSGGVKGMVVPWGMCLATNSTLRMR